MRKEICNRLTFSSENRHAIQYGETGKFHTRKDFAVLKCGKWWPKFNTLSNLKGVTILSNFNDRSIPLLVILSGICFFGF